MTDPIPTSGTEGTAQLVDRSAEDLLEENTTLSRESRNRQLRESMDRACMICGHRVGDHMVAGPCECCSRGAGNGSQQEKMERAIAAETPIEIEGRVVG